MAHLGHAVPLNRPSPLAGKVSDLIINSGLATVQQSPTPFLASLQHSVFTVAAQRTQVI